MAQLRFPEAKDSDRRGQRGWLDLYAHRDIAKALEPFLGHGYSIVYGEFNGPARVAEAFRQAIAKREAEETSCSS